MLAFEWYNIVRNQKGGKANEPEKKNQQSKQSDLAIAKLALLAGALEVAGAIINLRATIIDKMTQ